MRLAAGLPHFACRHGCPFCGMPSGDVIATVRYHDTAEANRALPDVEGTLFACAPCGIAYPSHVYEPRAFPLLYAKSLADLRYFDRNLLQNLRKAYITQILRRRDAMYSLSRLLDALTLKALQVPLIGRRPRDLRILDVGCGFGEFLEIFQRLGNKVVGTEIVPELVNRLRIRGFDVREGELESAICGDEKYDLVVMRAVFYRTRNPVTTLNAAKQALADGGELALLDPCPGREGAEYFFRKQFPQGQFYILEEECYLGMLRTRFSLGCAKRELIYGCPSAPLRPVRLVGNLAGFAEVVTANAFRQKPYVLNYDLRVA